VIVTPPGTFLLSSVSPLNGLQNFCNPNKNCKLFSVYSFDCEGLVLRRSLAAIAFAEVGVSRRDIESGSPYPIALIGNRLAVWSVSVVLGSALLHLLRCTCHPSSYCLCPVYSFHCWRAISSYYFLSLYLIMLSLEFCHCTLRFSSRHHSKGCTAQPFRVRNDP
jgi:hypothetical protein